MADDTRVVQMQFDNKDFEKNIKTSQSSLERFKSALNFDSTARGLERLGRSIKDVTFDTMASNIQKLADKFTGLGTVSEFVLSRIRSSLESMTGKVMNFMDSMTSVQMSAGFTKYESLSKAVQVLKSATGKEEDEVYAVLERLNKYTDETSYDFAEGVSSISKLVSSGAADMATAEKTVEGFFNLAAKAGADTQQASHALQYSINQAMGTGYMGLNDWKTLETLNIATIDFKEQLLEAAVAVGTVTKKGEKYYTVANKTTGAKKKEVNATNLWRDALKTQFVTTEVLNVALGKYQDTTTEFGAEAYAAAQRCTTFTDALNAWKDMLSTGWMTTYRTVFGDLSDAMNLFSGICNKVSDALDGLVSTRNNVLEAWKGLGGRDNLFGALFGEIETPDGDKLFEGAYGILDAITELGDTISEALWGVFMNLIPKDQQDRILTMVNSNLKALGLEKPFESFAELFNSDFFKETGGREGFLGGALQGITEDFQNAIGSIHGWFNEVDENGVTRMQKIQNVLTAVGRTIAFVMEGIGGLFHFFEVLGDEDHLGPSLKAIGDLLNTLGLSILDAENNASNSGTIVSFFDSLADILKPACEIINQVVTAITGLITSIVSGEESTGQIGGVLSGIGDTLKNIFGTIVTIAKPFVDFISKVIDIVGMLFRNGFDDRSLESAHQRISKAFSALWAGLKAAVSPIIEGIGVFFQQIWGTVFAKITEYFNDPSSIGYKILQPLKVLFTPIIDFFKGIFEKITGTVDEGTGEVKKMTVFEVLGDILNGAFQALSKVNLFSVAKMLAGGYAIYKVIRMIRNAGSAVSGIGDLIEKLQNPLDWLTGGLFAKKKESFTEGFSSFAKSIALLTGAIFVLGTMDVGSALKGIGLIALLMLEFVGIKKLMDVAKVGDIKMKGFIGFAISMGILVAALRPLANISWDQFGKMMAGLAGVLAELVGFMLLTSYLPIGTAQLGGFIGFALALGILIASLQMLKNMSWDQFGKMMAGLGGVLAQLIVFMLITSYAPIGTGQLGGFIGFAVSLAILIAALQPMKDMSWDQFGKMMAALGGVLAQLIVFMLITSYAPIGTGQLGGFISFAASLWLLIESIKPFADMNWEQYGRVMAALGGVLAQLLIFMGIMKAANLYTDVNLGGFIAFAGSIWLLVKAIMPFADMSWEQYGKVMAGLGGMLAELLIFMAILNAIPVSGRGIAAAVAIAAGISLMSITMAGALAQIRNVKWEVITAFTAGMATTIIAMAGAIAILSNVPLGAGLKGILLLSAGIAAIIGIVTLLGPSLISSLGDGLANISGKLEMVSGLLKGFSDRMGTVDEGNIDKAEGIFDKLKQMLTKLTGWGKFTGDLDNFTYAMFVLGTGMEIFNNHVGNVVTDLDSNAQAALKFIQDLSGCATDLDTISKINMDSLIAAIAGLGGAMSIYAMGAKEAQGLVGEGGEPDTAAVDAAIRIMQAISTGLAEAGGFTIPKNMPDDKELNLFGASLAALASALVQFEQAGSGLGSGTKQALKCLDFFQKLKNKLVNTEFAKNLGAAIGIFDTNDVKKEELTQFGANIEQLGLAMKSFYEATTILDEATGKRTNIDFGNATDTLDSLVTLQGKLDWDFGPVIQFFAGRKQNFLDLGAQIEGLGTAMSDFIDKVGGVDEKGNPKLDTTLFETAIKIAEKVRGYLVELGNKMGTVGGLWNIIKVSAAGRNYDFSDLKPQMEALATGLSSIGGMTLENKVPTVDQTKGIFKIIDEIVAYLNKLKTEQESVGGVVNDVSDFFDGYDFDFKALKTQLTSLGDGLAGLSVFAPENLPTAEELEQDIFPALDVILDYLNKLKNDTRFDDIASAYTDVDTSLNDTTFDFEDLERQLTALGTGLNSLASVNVDKDGKTIFNPDGRGAALDTVDALITYMTTLGLKLDRIGGLKEFFVGLWEGKEADFEYVGTQLGHLGKGLGAFNSGLTANGVYDSETVNSSLGALEKIIGIIQKVRTFSDEFYTMTGAVDGFGNPIRMENMSEWVLQIAKMMQYMSNVSGLEGSEGVQEITTSLAQFLLDFDAALTDLGGLGNANAADILNNVTQAISNLVTAAKNMDTEHGTYVSFISIGNQICNGLIRGIQEGQSGVITAAANMAAAAYEAAKAKLDINSPSRIFAGLGSSIGEGLVKGIDGSEKEVTGASTSLGQDAIDGASQAMATFAALMSQDIDANPTITPVLDLSNVKTGSDLINSLLGGQKTLDLSGAGGDYSRRSIPSSDRRTSEYTGQDLSGIYASIDKLGSRIDAMGTKISNMKIVLNTGTLVGEMTPGINNNLGAKVIYNRRRN